MLFVAFVLGTRVAWLDAVAGHALVVLHGRLPANDAEGDPSRLGVQAGEDKHRNGDVKGGRTSNANGPHDLWVTRHVGHPRRRFGLGLLKRHVGWKDKDPVVNQGAQSVDKVKRG